MQKNNKIIVSIIIPSFNNIDKLQRALQSIENINFPADEFEVIVVDDGSTDNTGKFIGEFIRRTKMNLRYIYQDNKGPAAARNTGIRHSSGEYLLIIDSDCFVDPNILKHYLKHFPDKKIGGVGGNVIPDEMNMITTYLDYIGVWRPGSTMEGIVYLVTANAFFVKKALVDAGFFDEEFRLPGGEEPELCYRMRKMGFRFKYDKNATVIHSHRTTLISMLKMFYTHGKGFGIFVSKWPDLSEYDPSFIRIIIGVESLQKFLSDFKTKFNLHKATQFFVLDYLRVLAWYFGYQNMSKKLRTTKPCQK